MLGVLSLTVGAFVMVTAEFLPIGVLPEVVRTFGITAGQAGLMVTFPGLLAALTAPGVMLFAGHADRRLVLLALSANLLAACLLAAVAPSFPVMLLSRAMAGLAMGGFWAMSVAVAARLVPPEQGGKATAAVFAGVTLAMIFGVPLGTFVAEYLSWRGAFALTGGLAAAALLMQLATLPRIPAGEAIKAVDLFAFARGGAERRSMTMIVLTFAAHFGAYTFVAPLMQEAGMTGGTITLVLFGYGCVGFASNLVASRYVGTQLGAALLTVLLLMLVTLVGLPASAGLPTPLIALILLWGIAWGALPLCLNVWTRTTSASNDEIGSAMFTLTGQLSISIGSGLGGAIVDHVGLHAVFAIGAALVAASALFLAFILRMRRRRAS